jgi:hypothetical protein
LQTGIGKITSRSGLSGLPKNDDRKKFRSKIAVFSLIFFASCATFKKPDQKSLKNNLEKICFSAEGKGRVQLSSKKYGFDFESLISRDKKKWALDFHFPGGREKLIEVDYKTSLSNQKEDFKRLLLDLGDGEFNDFLLTEFWEKMSKILRASEGSEFSLDWHVLRDKFIIAFPPKNDYFFHFEASELDLFYKRIKISIDSDRDRGIREPALQIELFLQNCSVI